MSKDDKSAPVTKDTQLLHAVKSGELAKVKQLLSEGANASFELHEEGTWGASHRESPIHHAIRLKENMMPMLELLLSAGANVNAKYEDYNWKGSGASETAFEMVVQLATENNDGKLLALFLKHGGDPNTKCVREAHTMRYDGREMHFPIHTAVRNKSESCTQSLLLAGANVNALATNRGQSEYGSGENDVETPLHIAVTLGEEKIVQLLLKSGADVNAAGQTLDNVHREVDSPITDPRDDRYIPSVSLILAVHTPIHLAIIHNFPQIVEMLLAAGADTNIPYQYGEKETNVLDLATTDQIKQMLANFGWNIKRHHLYPLATKKAIKTLLFCARNQKWPFTKDVLYLVCSWVAKAFQPPPALKPVAVKHREYY